MDKPADRIFVVLGAILAGTGVAAGAFGAHGLRGRVSPEMLALFEVGAYCVLVTLATPQPGLFTNGRE